MEAQPLGDVEANEVTQFAKTTGDSIDLDTSTGEFLFFFSAVLTPLVSFYGGQRVVVITAPVHDWQVLCNHPLQDSMTV